MDETPADESKVIFICDQSKPPLLETNKYGILSVANIELLLS